ncbi:hypothetical protein NITUZ_40198 [Candidatus Nitrosotenuis uzonensis]|uniref:Uncharacterized protein n=1 Tax=Candidatus Nitrosotenuis uzonensis TaxID=1407055 RepID=V6ATR2_9ARCH|nr:hypothetical protein NITUZ_40198 [Candidatus Nitrosotenuis uzonensis]
MADRLDFVDDLRHSLGYTIIEASEPFKDAAGTISLSETSAHEFHRLLRNVHWR